MFWYMIALELLTWFAHVTKMTICARVNQQTREHQQRTQARNQKVFEITIIQHVDNKKHNIYCTPQNTEYKMLWNRYLSDTVYR